MDLTAIERQVLDWNNTYPLDKWFRDKYKIPFGSEEHCKSNYIDILFEFAEQKLYKKMQQPVKEIEPYIPGEGNFLILQEGDENDIQNINLDDFKL